jgi:uncharacterized protein (TIGR03435 family)
MSDNNQRSSDNANTKESKMERFAARIVKHRKVMLRVGRMAAAIMALVLVLILGIPDAVHAQAEVPKGAAAVRVYKYEVVSIKRNKAEFDTNGNDGTRTTRDEFISKNEPLSTLIGIAYGIRHSEQLSGGPSWADSDRYDVEAKMDESVADELQKLSRDERNAIRQKMLQELLATRFNVKVHHESREFPVYFLEIAKSGSKLMEAKAEDPNAPKTPNGLPLTNVIHLESGDAGATKMTGHGVSISFLAVNLERRAGHIVVDKTGLTGNYDFSMQFMPEPNAPQSGGDAASSGADPGAPYIFTAVETELGLKLVAGRAPIDVVVIDHAEKPSEN